MPGRERGIFRQPWSRRQRRKKLWLPTNPSAYEYVVRITDGAALYARLNDRSAAGAVIENTGFVDVDGNSSGSPTLGYTPGAILTDTPNAAIDFDGTDDYLYFLDDGWYSASGGGSLTIEGWINPDTVAAGQQTIIGKFGTGQNEWEIRRDAAGLVFIVLKADATAYSWITVTNCLTVGQWTYFVMEIDTSFASNAAGFIKAYTNSVAAPLTLTGTSGTQPFTVTAGSENVYVGAGIASFNGKLDELAIYGYKLGQTAVTNHYTIAGYSAGLTIAIEQAVETDTAGAIDVDLTVPIGQATETDTASALTVPLTVPITQASETDTASALTVPLTILIDQAVETDTAQAFTVPLTVPIEQAVETDTAATLNVDVPLTITIEQAVETDTAGAFTANYTIAIEQAVETDTAFGFTVPLLVPITQAVETDTAQALTVPLIVPITQATETDTADALAVKLVVPITQAVETDTAENVAVIETGPQTIAIEQAVETDTAGALTVLLPPEAQRPGTLNIQRDIRSWEPRLAVDVSFDLTLSIHAGTDLIRNPVWEDEEVLVLL